MKLLSNLILLVVSGQQIRRLGPIVRLSILSKIKQEIKALDEVAKCKEEHALASQHDRQLSTMEQNAYMLQQYQRE